MNQSVHKKTELLSPAGSFSTLKAVIAAGADAVYAAGNKFGARAYAHNFTEEEMKEAIDYTHLSDRKLYLTVNTLLKDRELEEELYNYLLPYYETGLDAVIVQDLGVLRFIRSNFKDLPIHASTQMTITGALGAKLLLDAGCSRIVTARELSLEEISDIYLKTGAEIESFVHGALCYGYSGQCLLSSMIGGRSGNRGRCAQPCRLPYELLEDRKKVLSVSKANENYPLSLKDLCTIELIPELVESGIHSFKIEGRMKQTEYAEGVTTIYRKYLDFYEEHKDKPYQVSQSDMQRLLDLGNRCGFTQGYYKQPNGKNMITGSKPSHEKNMPDQMKSGNGVSITPFKEKIKGILILSKGNPARLVLECKGKKTEILGDEVQRAQKQPLSAETVREKIQKTGNTPFEFSELTLEIEEDVFIPVGALNELRRKALAQLLEQRLSAFRRVKSHDLPLKELSNDLEKPFTNYSVPLELRVLVETKEQFHYVLQEPQVTRIYIESAMFHRKFFSNELAEVVKQAAKAGKSCFLAMPYIFRKHTADWFKRNQEVIQTSGIDGYLIRSLEELSFLKEAEILPKQIQGDYGIYCFSDYAAAELRELGTGALTLPVELNRSELMRHDCQQSEMIIYGYQPLMISAQCPHKNAAACDQKKNVFYLQDRFGKLFFNKNQCEDCYNIIYNTSPLSLFHQADSIKKLGIKAVRLSFTTEGKKEINQAFAFYRQVMLEGKELDKSQYWQNFTNGHFKRGVE